MPKRARTNRRSVTDTSLHNGAAGDPSLPAWVEAVSSKSGLVATVARQMPATRSGSDTAVSLQIQPSQERLLTILEVAEQLAVSRKTVSRMIKRGDLPVVRFGRRLLRVRLSELRAMISSGEPAGNSPDSRFGVCRD